MVPDQIPPGVAELATDVTGVLVISWGLGAVVQQLRGGLGGGIVTSLRIEGIIHLFVDLTNS